MKLAKEKLVPNRHPDANKEGVSYGQRQINVVCPWNRMPQSSSLAPEAIQIGLMLHPSLSFQNQICMHTTGINVRVGRKQDHSPAQPRARACINLNLASSSCRRCDIGRSESAARDDGRPEELGLSSAGSGEVLVPRT